jgi:2,3-bisphosphoglycerate-dependent phosphoglycerate mutase
MHTELILIRHGETDWNAQGRIQGHTDIALNARGQAQAQRVAQAVAALHQSTPISAVISSDLQRAVQTAAPIAAACQLSVQLDAQLREKGYGVLEGLTWQERNAQHPDIDYEHELANPQFAVPQGESRLAFYERITTALQHHAQAHAGKVIVVVTHGGVLDMAYRAAMHMPLTLRRHWETPNAVLNSVTYSEGRFNLRYWADDYHISPYNISANT